MDEQLDYSTVAFTNISGEDFTWEFSRKPYTVKAGETKMYPEFLAKHLAKHLADKIMQEKGFRMGNDIEREKLYAQMLGSGVTSEPAVEEPKVKEPEPVKVEQPVEQPKVEEPVKVEVKEQVQGESKEEVKPFAGLNKPKKVSKKK